MDWDSFNRFADSNDEYKDVMKAAIEEAQKLEEQIKDGSLKVPFNTDVPNWEKIKSSAE